MSKLKTLNKLLNRFEEVTVGIALIVAVTLTFIEVVLRKFFGSSLGFTQELVVYLLIYTGLIGAAIGVREKVHLGVDLAIKQFPVKWQKGFVIITTMLCVLFTTIITILGIQQVINIALFGQVTPEMEIPLYVPLLIVPLAFGLMTIRFIQELIHVFKTPANEILQQEEGAY
ncbi:TRAP transporter small permease [Aquibacillus sp. 3ASR75-11]|uniref:TRAP transporter small permease n=1 Tax=Terrihalobacillus insolitus TaxID=2950438 RepID=A0A9X3WRC9_9BACI|nr:TRAP transporter small permease [Terrihalobacillus insolitus]MDC3423288.1 TRAP transporter small permease [Terrihalobacillus insolitus]